MNDINELINLIELDRVSQSNFIGNSIPVGSPNVYGGQVLAQGLYAMTQTAPEDRICNSLHAYFILPGNLNKLLEFDVENIRDGSSFSVRRVSAKQDGKVILFMSASFQRKEKGHEHQIKMPEVPSHNGLYSWDDMYQQLKGFLPKQIEQFLSIKRPIIFKPTVIINPTERVKLPPYQKVWFKIKGKMENNQRLNKSVLTYISDYNILATALQPHADIANFGNTRMASLDHSMWFHRDFDINKWMLFSIDSPSTSNARGFTRGNIFSENGKLIASVTQEGLMRPIDK